MQRFYPMLLALAIGGTAFAAPVQPAAKTQTAAAAQVEDYFNAMTTLEATFAQTQSDTPGAVQRGTFKANRKKGQFVWQYTTPVRQKVVGTGTAVYYVEQSARVGDGQVTQLPLDAGMGRLLRGGPLNLAAMKLQVAGVTQKGAQRQVALVPTPGVGSAANQGLKRLELVFNQPAGQRPVLAAFAATDALGVTLRISLTEVKAGGAIPAATFAYTPPQQRNR